jgi:ABC-type multidrug transport system permease subunit
MELIASGLVISAILGAFAMAIVMRLTRDRLRAPLTRGRAERAIEYGAGILGGLSILLTLMVACPEVTPASQEAALLGITVAMPVSGAGTWLAGELLAGPTRRSWVPMIFSFLAAQAGFMAPMAMFPWLDRHVLSGFLGEADARALSAALVTSFVLGGLASAWAYRRSRKEFATSP